MSKLLLQDDKKSGDISLVEKLSEDLSHLYLSQRYSDVVFVVEGERIHSASLTSFSKKLKITFLSLFHRSQGNIGGTSRVLPCDAVWWLERINQK